LYGYKLLKGFVLIQVIEGICMDGILEWNCPLENSIYKSLHVEMAEVRLYKASMHAYTCTICIYTYLAIPTETYIFCGFCRTVEHTWRLLYMYPI
jgi:hypothetical protein